MFERSRPPRSTYLVPLEGPRRVATVLNEYRAYIDDLYFLRIEQSALLRKLEDCRTAIGSLEARSRATAAVVQTADDIGAAVEAIHHHLHALRLELRYHATT